MFFPLREPIRFFGNTLLLRGVDLDTHGSSQPKKAPAAGRGFTYFWKYLVAPLVRKDVRSELEFATWLLCTP